MYFVLKDLFEGRKRERHRQYM